MALGSWKSSASTNGSDSRGPEVYTESGEVTDEGTAGFLRTFMAEFRIHVERVLTVIPRT